jgi:LEA14-like dessication related protein
MPLGLILLAGLGYLIYSESSKLTDNISFEPAGFKLKSETLFLKIINPTDTSATVNNVTGSIFSGKVKIGTYQVSNRFTIPEFGSLVIPVKLNLDKVEVAFQVIDVLKARKVPAISITGSIGTSVGNIAFENTIVDKIDLKNA